MVWVSAALASAIPIVLIGGLANRLVTKKGIGWQFIRFTVMATALPTIALLVLNNALNESAAGLIGAAMGYVFGKTSDGD